MNEITGLRATAVAILFALGCNNAPPGGEPPIGKQTSALTVYGYGWSLVYPFSGSSIWSYNSSGGTIVSTRYGTGGYQIDFNGIPNSSPSVAHVVAFGGPAHCKITWGHLGDSTKSTVLVSCYSAAGVATDSDFIVFMDARSGTTTSNKSAFFTVNSDTSINYEWNSSGVPSSAKWFDDGYNRGEYLVKVGGAAFSNASAQVTSLGFDNVRCKVEAWGTSWADGEVWVKCFDAQGVSTKGAFNLSFVDNSEIPDHIGGHALVARGNVDNNFANGLPYSPCFGGAPSSSSSASGSSVVLSMTNVAAANGTTSIVPLVTAQGSDNSYCNDMGWNVGSDGKVTTTIACYNGAGTQINASSVAFTTTFSNSNAYLPCIW